MKRYLVMGLIGGLLGLLVGVSQGLSFDEMHKLLRQEFPNEMKQYNNKADAWVNQVTREADQWNRQWLLSDTFEQKLGWQMLCLALLTNAPRGLLVGASIGMACVWIWNESCAAQEIAQQRIQAWRNERDAT